MKTIFFISILLFARLAQASLINNVYWGGKWEVYSSGYTEKVEDAFEVSTLDLDNEQKQVVETLRGFFQDIEPKLKAMNLQLPPVDIYIFPVMMEMYEENKPIGEQYDQAYYDPFESALYILKNDPKTKLNKEFWEMKSVILHEYGHHVFRQILEFDIARVPSKENYRDSTVYPSGYYFKNQRNHLQFEFALDEAFADVFAYAVVEDMQEDLKHYECIANRDPANPEFGVGYPKKVTKEFLNVYFSPYNIKLAHRQKCSIPEVQAPHTLGSMIVSEYVLQDRFKESSKADIFLSFVNEMADPINYYKENSKKVSAESLLRKLLESLNIKVHGE